MSWILAINGHTQHNNESRYSSLIWLSISTSGIFCWDAHFRIRRPSAIALTSGIFAETLHASGGPHAVLYTCCTVYYVNDFSNRYTEGLTFIVWLHYLSIGQNICPIEKSQAKSGVFGELEVVFLTRSRVFYAWRCWWPTGNLTQVMPFIHGYFSRFFRLASFAQLRAAAQKEPHFIEMESKPALSSSECDILKNSVKLNHEEFQWLHGNFETKR